MSFVLLGILNSQASGAAIQYYLGYLFGTAREAGADIVSDRAGGSYAFGFTTSSGPGGQSFFLARLDSSGEIVWQRTVGSAGNETALSVGTDSAGNAYIFGSGNSSTRAFVAKYNPSGVIQFQRTLTPSSGSFFGGGGAVDLSGNMHFASRQQDTGIVRTITAKYDSSGTLQWQQFIGSTTEEAGGAGVDSSGNVYSIASTRASGSGRNFLIVKYNSSGTIQWQREFGDSTNAQTARTVKPDNAGNVYAFGNTSNVFGSTDFMLVKYDDAGNFVWQRVLGGAGFENSGSLSLDSDGNIYVFGVTASAGAGGNDWLIAKYDPAGNLVFQRLFGSTGNETTAMEINLDDDDSMHLISNQVGLNSTLTTALYAKLPSDGSLTGTYQLNAIDFIYQAAALSGTTTTFPATTPSFTNGASSFISATSTFTDAAGAATATVTLIP